MQIATEVGSSTVLGNEASMRVLKKKVPLGSRETMKEIIKVYGDNFFVASV